VVTRIRYLLGEVFELKGYCEAFDSFPAIAAHVTAYGRMHLWGLMQKAKVKNYFYCDTDSVMVNEQGRANLTKYLNETQIGALKEENQSDVVLIRGLKDYTFGVKNVTKGIRRNAKKLDSDTYQQEQWPTFRGLLKSGDVNIYKVKKTIKHLSRQYTKGTVCDSGIVKPFVLSES